MAMLNTKITNYTSAVFQIIDNEVSVNTSAFFSHLFSKKSLRTLFSYNNTIMQLILACLLHKLLIIHYKFLCVFNNKTRIIIKCDF